MKLKTLGRLLDCSVLVVLLPVLIGALLPESKLTYQICVIAEVILVVIWVVAVRVLWRCPCCGEYLGRPGEKIRCCPQCGKELFGE